MRTEIEEIKSARKAITYSRIASAAASEADKRLTEQTDRCRTYAAQVGYEVVASFADLGAERPGMQDLLTFLRAQSILLDREAKAEDPTIVIVDDPTRLARDVVAYFKAKAAIEEAGGVIRCPGFDFGEDPALKFGELAMLALSEFASKRASQEDDGDDADRDFSLAGSEGSSPELP